MKEILASTLRVSLDVHPLLLLNVTCIFLELIRNYLVIKISFILSLVSFFVTHVVKFVIIIIIIIIIIVIVIVIVVVDVVIISIVVGVVFLFSFFVLVLSIDKTQKNQQKYLHILAILIMAW